MKRVSLFILICLLSSTANYAQNTRINKNHEQQIYSLIEKYTRSRETMDTVLLKSILTPDIDQLVSSGEWRNGIEGAMKGMVRSSESNPGDSTIKIDKIRFLNPECAVADARYEIQNINTSTRKMWSTFIVVYNDDIWKITAIRNMLPTGN